MRWCLIHDAACFDAEWSIGIKRYELSEGRYRQALSIVDSFDEGEAADPEQVQEINEARKDLNALRGHASHDLETAHKKGPSLASDTA